MIKNWDRHPTGLWLPRVFYSPGYPCCCAKCECVFCNEPHPQSYSIVVAGVSNDGCASCGTYNDTFVVQCDLDSDATGCTFTYAFNPVPCSDDPLSYLVFQMRNLEWRAWLGTPAFQDLIWRKTFATKPDCGQAGVVLTKFGLDSSSDCNLDTGSTATVTAL